MATVLEARGTFGIAFVRSTITARHSERCMPEAFKDYLKRHRLAADLKQDALAEMATRLLAPRGMAVSQSYISGLERGVNKQPHPAIVVALARALEIPAMEMLAAAGLDITDLLPGSAAGEAPEDAGKSQARLVPGMEIIVELRSGTRKGTLTEKSARILADLIDDSDDSGS